MSFIIEYGCFGAIYLLGGIMHFTSHYFKEAYHYAISGYAGKKIGSILNRMVGKRCKNGNPLYLVELIGQGFI